MVDDMSEGLLMQEQLDTVFAEYEGKAGELIPVLQDIQDVLGYLPKEALAETARFLSLAESTVYGVATFYTQFYLTKRGRHRIKVCQGTACHVGGADDIMRAIEDKLGIGAGQSTDDFEFNLEEVACFGSCALAPVVVVNDKVYGNVTPERVIEILERLA